MSMIKIELACPYCKNAVTFWANRSGTGQIFCPYCILNPPEHTKFGFGVPEHLLENSDNEQPFQRYYDPLHKGIWLENQFVRAITKIKNVDIGYIMTFPNSAMRTGILFDLLISGWNTDKKDLNDPYCADAGENFHIGIDVKGSNEQRVYFKDTGKSIKDKMLNADKLLCTPFIAFPEADKEQLTNPKFWYIHKIDKSSFLKKISSQPSYNKLVENSISLLNLVKTL